MKTKIKVTEGHLTAWDKKALLAIINAGMTAAKVGRKEFRIYSDCVNVTEPISGWNGSYLGTFSAKFIAA